MLYDQVQEAAATIRAQWTGRPRVGIILGTGHNALVLQAYLARSGLRVLSLDRAARPGGGLATVENPRLPGFSPRPAI